MTEQKDIKTLQAEGKGPAPCARFCEATAFNIEIAGLQRDQSENLKNQCKLVDQITALTAERDELSRLYENTLKREYALHEAARLALDEMENVTYAVLSGAITADVIKFESNKAALKAVLMRCGRCAVVNGKLPPTKFIEIKESK